MPASGINAKTYYTSEVVQQSHNLIVERHSVYYTLGDAEVWDVKKSTLGRKVTYLMGGDPNADRVLDCDKRDLPDDPDNKVVQELDDFFKDQEDSNNQ